ncbi:DUF1634 domain-containing protein [Brucella intermedia]|uniref:DUF1634 domain-containing protein n=1 Tax=Brucella ciceri TaxID=391287 RepID=A0ABX1DUX5_9HYPH|nr:DUF1634 domain-containing protein [Brucella intermedia]NKC28724.1 DUF1634 domain-containing protein [Brucella ciceri]
MKSALERRDYVIAGLLCYGTWFATAMIAVGVILTAVKPFLGSLVLPLSGFSAVKAGVAVLIFLPVARLALMLILFLRDRDHVYTAITALVLAVIGIGVLIEI